MTESGGRPPATCPRCGAQFGCGAGTGSCWCGAVATTPALLGRLEERYAGCLCPACLEGCAREDSNL